MNKNQILHFCWLFMDFGWLIGLKWFAIFMIIPTLIITLICLRGVSLVSMETIFANWTLMNVFWMLGEFFPIIPGFVSKLFLIFGFTLFLLFVHDEYLLK